MRKRSAEKSNENNLVVFEKKNERFEIKRPRTEHSLARGKPKISKNHFGEIQKYSSQRNRSTEKLDMKHPPKIETPIGNNINVYFLSEISNNYGIGKANLLKKKVFVRRKDILPFTEKVKHKKKNSHGSSTIREVYLSKRKFIDIIFRSS